MSSIFGTLCNPTVSANENMKKLELWNRAYGRDTTDSYQNNNIHLGCCLTKRTYF